MKEIDFYISNNNHHWQMVRPVMRELISRGDVRVRLISLCEFRRMDTPAAELNEMGVPFVRLGSLKFGGASTSTGKRHIGGNLSPVRNFLRQIVWQFKVKGKLKTINRQPPDLVVVPNDIAFPFDKLCRWFRRKRITFFLFQEGIRFPLPNEGDLNYGTNGPAEILSWGEASANYFRGLKSNGATVRLVGNPRFDEMMKVDYANEVQSIRSRLPLGKLNVLYVSNPVDDQGFCSHDDKLELFRQFLKGVRILMQEHGLTVMVRLHPREDLAAFKNEVKDPFYKDRVFWVQENSLFACLKVTDLTVILASTVGLEAMLCEVPVAVVKLGSFGYVFNYVSSGAALPIDVYDDFSERLLAAMTTQKAEFQARSRAYVSDQLSNLGTSASFIADHLIAS